MRLIFTTDEPLKANQLANLLKQHDIQNQLEVITNKDWGSHDYGHTTCRLWVYNEEQFEKAQELIDSFNTNPNDPQFTAIPTSPLSNEQPINATDPAADGQIPTPTQLREPMGRITRFLLLICTFLFVSGSLSEPEIKTTPPTYLPTAPIYLPSVNKTLMFDYPEAYEVVDKLVATYGLEALKTPEALPSEGKQLIQKFEQTPYWKGYYPKFVDYVKGTPVNWNDTAPMFEKIKQGEVWRIFTPCLLHNDIFHLFFNMIWLVVLGRQIESRIGGGRYILFIIVAAVVTNTAQYLMSGSNFLGFSGVLCAMLTFIWVRQKKAGWEGYRLEKGTLGFIVFFILFMFALQLISFFLEAKTSTALPIGIANTAHLVGGFIGVILARLSFFSWRHS